MSKQTEWETLDFNRRLASECKQLRAVNAELLAALKDARYALYGNGTGNPKIDAAIAKAESCAS